MLGPKRQEALGNLILTYGEDNARELWIETYGFRVDVLISMAKYDKSGIVPVDKLMKSMILLRNVSDQQAADELPLDVDIDSEAILSIYEAILAASVSEYGEDAVTRLLRRQAAKQQWDCLLNEYDYKYIETMQLQNRQDMGKSDGK